MAGVQKAPGRVPPAVRLLLGLALALQVGLRMAEPRPTASAADLPAPPSVPALRTVALGEPIGLAQVLTLYLQAFDTQPGISVPFKDLDYHKLAGWLSAILALHPDGQYPLLLAAQVYAQVPDADKQRRMLDLVYREFERDPQRRWRWLAHAAIVAKHRLHDLPLALRYAQALAERADHPSVPSWARQMHIFLLEDLGEYEAARILLGGLLASGAITDPHEALFLTERLNALKNVEKSTLVPK
ncbi:MAG TPA: hypothetical protein VNM24_08300 [Burkholderiales bacterium]|jgi:hypothetical protein|nr:hypothetical protein [Burkholderiales bacterium]